MNTRVDQRIWSNGGEEEWIKELIEICAYVGFPGDPAKKAAEIIVMARSVRPDDEVDYSERGRATHDAGWDVPTQRVEVIA